MTPDIITAIQDPNLLRPYLADDADLASWGKWLTMLRCLYGLPVSEDEHGTIRDNTGRDPDTLPSEGFSEALLLCGRRSGKSKIVALIGAAEAVLSGREKRMSAGEIPMVAIVSPTRFQSRIIHSYLKGCFESTPLLAGELVEEKKESFVLKNGVEVAILTGSPSSARGFSIIACVVDEVCFFGYSEESKVRSDTELIRALRPSLATTGGKLIAVGSPYAAKGWAHQTWRRCYGNDASDVLVWNAPSMAMNPTLKQSVIDRAMEEDPVAARVEYVTERGAFREDVSGYITRAEVEALVIQGRKELPPRRGIRYAAFCDMSGGRHDDAALAIGHREGNVIVIDCLQRFPAPHAPTTVVAEIVNTLRRYGCTTVTGDWYSAEWVRSAYRSHGITYERASRSEWKEGASVRQKVGKSRSQLYLELLPRLHSGEIELLDDEILISQLSSLQRRTRSGGRDSIDHAPGAHDDIANAAAGCAAVACEKRITAGAMPREQRAPHQQRDILDRMYDSNHQWTSADENELLKRQAIARMFGRGRRGL